MIFQPLWLVCRSPILARLSPYHFPDRFRHQPAICTGLVDCPMRAHCSTQMSLNGLASIFQFWCRRFASHSLRRCNVSSLHRYQAPRSWVNFRISLLVAAHISRNWPISSILTQHISHIFVVSSSTWTCELEMNEKLRHCFICTAKLIWIYQHVNASEYFLAPRVCICTDGAKTCSIIQNFNFVETKHAAQSTFFQWIRASSSFHFISLFLELREKSEEHALRVGVKMAYENDLSEHSISGKWRKASAVSSETSWWWVTDDSYLSSKYFYRFERMTENHTMR